MKKERKMCIRDSNKGADAVYLGGNKFSARAYASNFDNENMQKELDYSHSYLRNRAHMSYD